MKKFRPESALSTCLRAADLSSFCDPEHVLLKDGAENLKQKLWGNVSLSKLNLLEVVNKCYAKSIKSRKHCWSSGLFSCSPSQLLSFKVRWFSSVLILSCCLFILTGAKQAWQAAGGEVQPCHAMPWLPHLAFLVSFISTASQFHTPMSQNSFLWVTLVRFSTNFESAYHSSYLLPCCLLSSATRTPTCAVSQRVLSIESISH